MAGEQKHVRMDESLAISSTFIVSVLGWLTFILALRALFRGFGEQHPAPLRTNDLVLVLMAAEPRPLVRSCWRSGDGGTASG
ncbi:hypothetical protein [Streptomyces sp. NPDC050264]|uniref:hypothetical protein n=1 Tax=Streptomyces sp. NPDC050264 TaxID=3155038 RepID=UPI003415F9FB